MGTPRFDADAAATFLAQSRSRFLREAGRWLVELDDPADVLIMLSGDVGQHLGPWDCYRHCALLGLHHSGAVKNLALDVLNEEPDAEQGPPVAPAFAVAWAHDAFPDEEAPFAHTLLEMLQATQDDPRVPRTLTWAAMLALCGPRGVAKDKPNADDLGHGLRTALREDDAQALAVPVWEGAVLGGVDDVAGAAQDAAALGQQVDGGLTALSGNVLLRGFVTLRGLALHRRVEAPAAEP